MTEPKSEPKRAEPAKPAVTLGRASESSDPAVQAILAQMQTHRSNGDEAALAGCIARLAALGYE